MQGSVKPCSAHKPLRSAALQPRPHASTLKKNKIIKDLFILCHRNKSHFCNFLFIFYFFFATFQTSWMGIKEVPGSVASLVCAAVTQVNWWLYGASAGSAGDSCGAAFMIPVRILSWIAIRSLSLSASPSHLFSSLCFLLGLLTSSGRGCAV